MERPLPPPTPGPLSRTTAANIAEAMRRTERTGRFQVTPPLIMHDGASGLLIASAAEDPETIVLPSFGGTKVRHRTRGVRQTLFRRVHVDNGLRLRHSGVTGRISGSLRIVWDIPDFIIKKINTQSYWTPEFPDTVTFNSGNAGRYAIAGTMSVLQLYGKTAQNILDVSAGATSVNLDALIGPPEGGFTAEVTIPGSTYFDLGIQDVPGSYTTDPFPMDVPGFSTFRWKIPDTTFRVLLNGVPVVTFPIDDCFTSRNLAFFTEADFVAGNTVVMDLEGEYVQASGITFNMYQSGE